MAGPESRFVLKSCRMSTYLLIHGAWHGGWCWRKLLPLLEGMGHTVLAPDLPGHGNDKTPTAMVTLDRYTDYICQIAAAQSEPVILVGHSMAGVAITQVGENCPSHVATLVYICAVLPRNGDALMTWMQRDRHSLIHENIIPMNEKVVRFRMESVHEVFYGNCTNEDEDYAKSHFVLQAIAPSVAPVNTTAERWGLIPRYYIECAQDRALTVTIQREMQRYSPCLQSFSIDTDHSPFFSAPEKLATVLSTIGSLSRA